MTGSSDSDPTTTSNAGVPGNSNQNACQAAYDNGTRSLRLAALDLVKRGGTTISEIKQRDGNAGVRPEIHRGVVAITANKRVVTSIALQGVIAGATDPESYRMPVEASVSTFAFSR